MLKNKFYDIDSREYYLTLFSENFKDYTSNPKVKKSLPSLISSTTGIGNNTAMKYICDLRSNKQFSLMRREDSSFSRLCKILDVMDQDFVGENVEFLYDANERFREFRIAYLENKK